MNERVLITGAGSGLGLEMALYLAKQGYEVYAGVLTPQQEAEVDEQASQQNLPIHTLQLDVTDERCARAKLEPLFEQSSPYAVIHSAGISLRGYFEDCDDDEIRQVLDVNLFGAMAVTRIALPYMRTVRRGRLIFISSVGGRIASMARTAYCASKFALEGFAEGLMQELMPLGIHVSIVEPAIIKTERWTVHRGVARRASAAFSPYAKWFQKEEELADTLVATSPTKPSDVAEEIYRALQSPQPRLRYVVGKRAKLVLQLRRFLPGELFERLYFGEAMRRVAGASTSTALAATPTRVQATPTSSSNQGASRLEILGSALKALGLSRLLGLRRAKQLSGETIRGYYITRAIITLLNLGVFDEINRRGFINMTEFAQAHNLNLKILQTLFDYLYIQRFLDYQDGLYMLAKDGIVVNQSLRGAFHIVNAYEDLVGNMEAMVRQEKVYRVDLFRRPEAMDIGSGLVGQTLAFPLMRDQIIGRGFGKVLDVGCGDASFLTYLCRDNPQIRAVGLDIEPKGILLGQQRIVQEKLQGQITLVVGDLFNLGLSSVAHSSEQMGANGAIEVITMFYVLHELQDRIVPALLKLKEMFPNAWVMLCEVIRHSRETLRQNPGGVSEIQFFHELSNQRLYTREEWQQMFVDAGAVEVQDRYLEFVRTSIFSVRWH